MICRVSPVFSVIGNATNSFRAATGTSKWNQVRKFSTSSAFPWQKRQVTDTLIFPRSLPPATIARPWSFCHVSVFPLSRSSRGSLTVIFDRRTINVHVETNRSHSALVQLCFVSCGVLWVFCQRIQELRSNPKVTLLWNAQIIKHKKRFDIYPVSQLGLQLTNDLH